MRLTISRDLLQTACKIVQPALSNSAINPILGYMHFRVHAGSLTLRCSDGDLEIRQAIALADLVDDYELLIPGVHFFGIVGKLPKGDVTLEAEGNKLTVKCAKSKFTIPLHPEPQAFPRSANVPELQGFNSTCGDIHQLMTLSGYCGTTGAESKWLGYVLIKLEGGTLEMASVGGEKTVAFNSLPGVSGLDGNWRVPVKYFQLAQKLIGDADGETHIYICGERRLSFQFGNTVLSLPLGTLGFADYKKPLPPEINHIISVDAAELGEVLKRLEIARSFRVFAPDNCVDFSTADGQLILSVDHGQDGTASEQMAAEIKGEGITYSIDSGSLLKALGPVTTGRVDLSIMDEEHPMVISSPRHPEWRALVANLVK